MSDNKKDDRADALKVKEAAAAISVIKQEMGKVVFGQGTVIDSLLRALLCNGHVLVEGVPGIAKTLAIKTLAEVSGCSAKRIQFTAEFTS